MNVWPRRPVGEPRHTARRAPTAGLQSAFRVLLLLSAGQLACTTPEAERLGWSVAFACSDVGERAQQVRVSITPGACSASTRTVYEAVVVRGGAADVEAPGTLPAGTYAFRATAFDGGDAPIAEGCRTVTLPRTDSVAVELFGSEDCGAAGGDDDWMVVNEPDGGLGGSADAGATDGADGADGGETALGLPRIELVTAELLEGQPIPVRFFDVTKPGHPMLGLYESVSGTVVATFQIPFKRKEEVVSGTHDFAGPPPGIYDVALAYDDGVASSARVEVVADRDRDGTPDTTDDCADDPMKTQPGQCGCGVSDADADADEIADCVDECPSDALKSVAGFCGCGFMESFFDQDEDGLADCYDECPTDASKTKALVCGCGLPETDTDGDASLDCLDECAMDPAKTAAGACGCGQAETDRDADLTPDCTDMCPDDPAKVAPQQCGCGMREPFDTSEYRDAKGYRCSDWRGYDCRTAVEKYGYTQAAEDSLLANCSASCSLCPAS